MFPKRFWMRMALTVPLAAVILFSGLQLWNINRRYRAEAEIHRFMLSFKPAAVVPEALQTHTEGMPAKVSFEESPVHHAGIAELRELNEDVIGWLTIDGTAIDYPFTRGDDNDFYLRRDINKDTAYAGTVFMDYRNQADFSDLNTILYGHNMKNGSMFHHLTKFGDKEFFNSHTTATIYLENENIPLEIFAYMILPPIDLADIGYGMPLAHHVDYLRAHAQIWRNIEISANDRLVTLSTCSYEFNDARTVVVAKIL